MASNGGRGPSRPADFRYTDTIADRDANQAILVKQDAFIARHNAVAEASLKYLKEDFATFRALSTGRADDALGYIDLENYFIAGLSDNPQIGAGTTLTADFTDTSITIADPEALGPDFGALTIAIFDGTRAYVQSITIVSGTFTYTVAALVGADIPSGSRVVHLQGVDAINSIDLPVVNLQN